MEINLREMSLEALDDLRNEISAEINYRVLGDVAIYPVPEITGNRLQDVMAYTRAHGYLLSVAHTIVSHHYNTRGL